MQQTIINVDKFNKFNPTEKDIFDAYRKSLIIMFTDSSSDAGEYPKETIEIIEKMAFVFLELLPKEIKNPTEFFAPTSVVTELEKLKLASATAMATTTTGAENGVTK